MTHRCLIVVGLAMVFVLPAPTETVSAGPSEARDYRGDEILVCFKTVLTEGDAIARLGGDRVPEARRFRFAGRPESPTNRLHLLRIADGWTVEEAMEELASREDVDYVQPNYIHRKAERPDDPLYDLQWAFENTGEVGHRGPMPRLIGADMKIPEAWDLIETLPFDTVIVGVVDTGVDYTHEDLAENMWVNSGEIEGNGADDDGNGYVDDIHGWDFAYDDDDPMDGDGHGTHVAGIVGAVTNNGRGIAGIAGPHNGIKIMALKFLDDTGTGDTADAIDAIGYGITNGAHVLNASWGGGGYEPALETAILDAHFSGVTFVAAAGNRDSDNDATPYYPSSYDVSNIVSVGASNPWALEAGFSNYGADSVDLAAPGEEILSAVPGSVYAFDHELWDGWGGTSMATPYVSGAAALVYALGPELWPPWNTWGPMERVEAVIDRLRVTTEPYPDFEDRTVTGGHLDFLNLVETDSVPPEPVSDLFVINTGTDFVTLRFTATGDDGTAGRANRYDLRYEDSFFWSGFDDGIRVRSSARPGDPGQWDYLRVSGLEFATDYTFQLQVLDNTGNASGSSNLVLTSTAPGTELFFDDMEAGPGAWATESNQPLPWELTASNSFSPTHSWTDSHGGNYPDNLDSSLVSPTIDLSGSGAARLTFWHMYDLEDGSDFGYVEATVDGVNWNPLLTLTGANPLWSQVTLDLTAYAGGTVQVRFRIVTDSTIAHDGWYVDDVVVLSTMVPPEAVLFEDSFTSTAHWNLSEGHWGLEGGRLADSPGATYGDNEMSAACLANPLDLSTSRAARLSFDLEHDLHTGQDFLYLQLSTDGEFWRTLRRWTGFSSGHPDGLDLSPYGGYPEVWLRFLLSSGEALTGNGSSIDNLHVETVSMPDGDHDGVIDIFDCAPYDDGSFAPPLEILELGMWADRVTLVWQSDAPNCGPGVVYDVLRGRLDELPVGSGSADETCIETALPDTLAVDGEDPAPGAGYFYLVRGVNACAAGTWGEDSLGLERISSGCP